MTSSTQKPTAQSEASALPQKELERLLHDEKVDAKGLLQVLAALKNGKPRQPSKSR